jgi:hypothetical protein
MDSMRVFAGSWLSENRSMQTNSLEEDEVRNRIKFIQLQLTEYSAISVISVALEGLAQHKPWTFPDLQAMPGLTLLLVKWALQNPSCGIYLGKSITIREFDNFRQRLWNLTGMAKSGSENTYAMVRSILSVQIDFQRRSPWGFMRWPSLLAKLAPNHPSRAQFFNAFGISPEDFIDACWILQQPLQGGNLEIGPKWFASIPDCYKDSVVRILRTIGRDVLELRENLTSHWSTYQPSSWELFESPFAKKYPLLNIGENSWRLWHPAMFERGMEEAVHLGLTHLGSEYTEVFSRVFEAYVVDLASEMMPDHISESKWKAAMGHNAPSVEAILPAGSVNIFVEAKMSLFHDAALIEDTELGLSRRLERIIYAVEQGWKVSKLLRQRPREFPTRTEACEEYLLIVTNRELNMGSGQSLERLISDGRLQCPDADTQARLPLQNVFIMSVEGFEHLQQTVIHGKVELLDVLRSAKAANADASTAAMYFDDHLKKYTKNWRVPELLRSAQAAAVARLTAGYQPGS